MGVNTRRTVVVSLALVFAALPSVELLPETSQTAHAPPADAGSQEALLDGVQTKPASPPLHTHRTNPYSHGGTPAAMPQHTHRKDDLQVDSVLSAIEPPDRLANGMVWRPPIMDDMTATQVDSAVASARKKAKKALLSFRDVIQSGGRRKAQLSQLAGEHKKGAGPDSYDDGFWKDYQATAKEYVANSNKFKPLLDYSDKWAKWFALAKKKEFEYWKALAKEMVSCFPKPIPTPTCPKDYLERLKKWNSAITASDACKGQAAGNKIFMETEGEVHEKLDKRPEDDVKLVNKRFNDRWSAIKSANGEADEEKEPDSVSPGALAANDAKTMLSEGVEDMFSG